MRSLSAPLLVLALILTCPLWGIAGADSYYVITSTAGDGGSIVPSENVLVILNGSEDFTIIPDFGYRIEDVLVNGRSVGPRSVYTFYDVYYDQSISASFTPLPGSVSIESDPPGASVYIDGMYVGRTKQKGAIVIDNVPAGTRTIELVLDGYSRWSSQIQVKGSETTNVPLIQLLPLTLPTTLPPTTQPTTVPSTTIPTTLPSTIPTTAPTTIPTTVPTTIPTTRPTSVPTTSPLPTTTSIPATTTIPTTDRTTVPTTLVTTAPPTTSQTTTQATTTPPTSVPPTSVTTTSPTPTSTGTTIPYTTATQAYTTAPTTSTWTTSIPTLTTPPSAATPTQQGGTVVPVVSDTESTLPLPTTTGPAPSLTVEPVTSTTTPVPLFPPLPSGINPTMVLLLAGSLSVVPLVADLAGKPRMTLVLQARRKAIITFTYMLVIAGLVAAGVLAWRSGVFQGTLSPFTSMILPISIYLACSGFILIPGTLLSRPLRWTLSGHLLFSLAGIFVAALAMINTPPTLRLPLLLVIASACAGAVIARWESGCMGPCRDPVLLPPAPAPETLILPRSPTIPNAFPAELLERYSEPQLIGMGGVSRVFKAIQNQSGETVALKIPVQFNETAGKCFMKEIKAWEDLSHENIVKIHEVNILPVPYVEMEFIESSLADLKKPLPPGDAARIVRDIARGLHYAHSQGIVHRDIKPQNILMDSEGVPRITDWGMSKVMGAGSLPTITGFSLSYAAPEQISADRFGDTDQRTDIYQLGVVFFELLTGELPFGGDDIPRVSSRILTEIPPVPSRLNMAALAYDRIVMRCLEKAQSARYQSVQEMVDDLEKILVTQIDIERYEIFDE